MVSDEALKKLQEQIAAWPMTQRFVVQQLILDYLRNREDLRAYKDTGLTPEETKRMSNILMDVGIDYNCSWEYVKNWLLNDHLRELDKADKDGRLVVLPCKVGDTVYEVTSRKTISEYRVKAIRVELFCTFIEWDIAAGFVDKSIFGVPVDEIGKTVFLTREKAEKALETMKNE